MNQNTFIQDSAWELRYAIERGQNTAPAVANLIAQLGGDSTIVERASSGGRPHLVGVYMVALLLTQPQG